MPDHVNGTVVVLTHNRRPELLRTLRALSAPNERPPVVAIDNGNASSDGTPDAVAAAFSGVGLTRLDRNFGAVGRNIAVDAAPADCVAFCGDDAWWEPGWMTAAVHALDAHPGCASVAARIVVELRTSPVVAPGPTPGPAS